MKMERLNMNTLEAKMVKTCYGYDEFYWVVDGQPITTYLEQHRPESLSAFGSLSGLLPAWSGKLIWQWENDLVWEMVSSEEELNVPILVCEDDCDLSCIVITAHIRKTETMVYWDRIGRLDHSHFDLLEYNQSGILCLESYTDEDWENYGSNIGLDPYGSAQYWKWVSENCYEEHMRRQRNYMKPFMQDEQNMEWIWSPEWKFERKQYEAVVTQYQEIRGRS